MTVGAVDMLGYITAWQAACWVAFRHFDDAPNQEGISYDPQQAEKMASEIKRYVDFCDSIPKAETQLLEAIKHEKLPAYGANAGELTQIPVLYLNTEGVKLLSASNAIQSTHDKADADNKPKAWMDVKFRKADVVRLWPTIASLLEKVDDPIQADGMQLSPPQDKADDKMPSAKTTPLISLDSTKKKLVPQKELKEWLEDNGAVSGKILTRDQHHKLAKSHFVEYRVPRIKVVAARKAIWPNLMPGPRKEADA